MKTFAKTKISILIISIFLGIISIQANAADTSHPTSYSTWEAVDTASTGVGSTKAVADTLNSILRDHADAAPDLVNLLDKMGLDGGWAKQIGALKKISGKLEVIGFVLDHGDTVVQLTSAYQNKNRDEFAKIIADKMIEIVAQTTGGLAGKLFYSKVPGAIAAAIVTGGWSILAAPGLIVGGYIAEDQTKEFVSSILRKNCYDLLQEYGQTIYDILDAKNREATDSIPEWLLPSADEPTQNKNEKKLTPVTLERLEIYR